MKKKKYIQPELKEVKLILPTILANSTNSTEDIDWNEEITDDSDIA